MTVTSAPSPDRHARRVGADHAAADDDHACRWHPRHAAEQQALAAGRLAQGEGRGLDRQAPGDFAHRRQQRQAAVFVGDGLVGHGDAAGIDEAARLLGVGRQVQIGEEDLRRAQHPPLRRLRLLDLDDHVGGGKDLGRGGDDARAGGRVGGIGGADARTRAGLHQHLVAGRGVLAHGRRRQADAVFLDLDFLGDADTHGSLRTWWGWPPV